MGSATLILEVAKFWTLVLWTCRKYTAGDGIFWTSWKNRNAHITMEIIKLQFWMPFVRNTSLFMCVNVSLKIILLFSWSGIFGQYLTQNIKNYLSVLLPPPPRENNKKNISLSRFSAWKDYKTNQGILEELKAIRTNGFLMPRGRFPKLMK